MRCIASLSVFLVVAGCGRLGFDPEALDGGARDVGPTDAMIGDTGGSDGGPRDGGPGGDTGVGSDSGRDSGPPDGALDGSVAPPLRCDDSAGRTVFCAPDVTVAACCMRPVTSVFDAIDQFDSFPGPTLVLVRSGTYASQPRIIREAAIFRGVDDGGGRPVLAGSNAPVFNLRGNDVTIEGFEIRGVDGGGPGLISIIQDDPTALPFRGDILIRDNVLASPNESGIYVGLATTPTLLRNLVIVDNIIEDTPRFTFFMAGVSSVDGVVVSDNCFLPPSGLNVEVPYGGVTLTDNYWGVAGGPGPGGVTYGGPAPVAPVRDVCHVR